MTKISAYVLYGQSYAWTDSLLFASKAHVMRHMKEPWNYPALGEDQHPRSFWPLHGDWYPGQAIAETSYGTIEVGPRGGLFWR